MTAGWSVLASLRNIKRAGENQGWWGDVTPDGSPLVLRDAGIEEIYVPDVQFP